MKQLMKPYINSLSDLLEQADVPDIAFEDIFDSKRHLIIKLAPLRQFFELGNKSTFPKAIIGKLLEADHIRQQNFVFLGSKDDVINLIDCAPEGKEMLLNNSSVAILLEQDL